MSANDEQMKQNYALPESQKWREHVSHDGAARDMGLRTVCESTLPFVSKDDSQSET